MNKIIWLVALLFSLPTLANWQLDQQNSAVTFITIKKEHIAENQQFNHFSATIGDQGQVTFVLDLASVDTHIAVRDQRIKEYLFNTKVFPQATFNTQVEASLLQQLAIGESNQVAIDGVVDLHGQKQTVAAKVLITKISANDVLVSSIQPMLIKAQDFDLVKGINKLKELAKLPSISETVPVSFVLKFTRQ